MNVRKISKKLALAIVQIFYPLLRPEEIRDAVEEAQKIIETILEEHRTPPPRPSEN